MSSLADSQSDPLPGPLELDLQFLVPARQAALLALRPGDRLSVLRRQRLLPMAQAGKKRNGVQVLSASDRALTKVLDDFAATGIPALVLKGTALAHSLYEHAELRPRTDADVLIAHHQLDDAITSLERLGFSTPARSLHDAISTQMTFSASDPDICAIDLHFALSNRPEFARSFSFSDLWTDAIALPRLSPQARALHPRHALMLAAMHYYGHSPVNERPAIWLFDIALLARSLDASSWAKVDLEGRAVGICGLLAAAIDETRTWFDCPYPQKLLDGWRKQRSREWRSARVETQSPPWRDLNLALRGLPSFADRLRYLWRRAFPEPEWMRAEYGAATRTELLRAYLIRLMRGLRRRARKAI